MAAVTRNTVLQRSATMPSRLHGLAGAAKLPLTTYVEIRVRPLMVLPQAADRDR